jgi:hypothetical protein
VPTGGDKASSDGAGRSSDVSGAVIAVRRAVEDRRTSARRVLDAFDPRDLLGADDDRDLLGADDDRDLLGADDDRLLVPTEPITKPLAGTAHGAPEPPA